MERARGGASSARSPTGQTDAALATLRADFPEFRIWREITGNRIRYIARSLHADVRPHTVVTPDLAELRAELERGPARDRPKESTQ
jgi:hypothetical protein